VCTPINYNNNKQMRLRSHVLLFYIILIKRNMVYSHTDSSSKIIIVDCQKNNTSNTHPEFNNSNNILKYPIGTQYNIFLF